PTRHRLAAVPGDVACTECPLQCGTSFRPSIRRTRRGSRACKTAQTPASNRFDRQFSAAALAVFAGHRHKIRVAATEADGPAATTRWRFASGVPVAVGRILPRYLSLPNNLPAIS